MYMYEGLMIFRKIKTEECETIGHGYRATAAN